VNPVGGPTGGQDLCSVSLDARGDLGFAVGRGGAVLKWDGTTWTPDGVAISAARGGNLQAVAVDASGKRALAIGAGGLVMSWDGKTWSHARAAEKLAAGRDLFAVGFDETGRTAWVVGQYGVALRWNGSKWARVRTPFTVPGYTEGGAPVDTFGMWSVWVEPGGAGALASGNGNRILRWNGKAWKDDPRVPSLHFDGDAFSGVRSIAASRDGRKGWMVGAASTLTWSGAKWQKAKSADGPYVAVDCNASGTTAFAVDIEGNVARWDGSKWAADASGSAASAGNALYAVSLNASGDLGFAVGKRGLIVRWDGKAWKRDSAGERPSFGRFSAVAVSADGGSGLAVGAEGVPLRWKGAAWSADTSPGAEAIRLNELWMSPAGDTAFGAGEDGIYRWNGSAWTAEPSGRSLHALAMTPKGELGFAGSVTGAIYRYDGSRWAEDPQGTREAGGKALYAMSLSSDGKLGFAAGSNAFLQWDGSAWHRDPELSAGDYNGVSLNAKSDLGFASGSGPVGTILRSDGRSWRPDLQAGKVLTDPGPYHMALSADGRSGIAVSFQGTVFTWDGNQWSRDPAGTKLAQGQRLVAACVDPAGRSGWVLGEQGFLMRYQAASSPKD
jgi:hypothetical protein